MSTPKRPARAPQHPPAGPEPVVQVPGQLPLPGTSRSTTSRPAAPPSPALGGGFDFDDLVGLARLAMDRARHLEATVVSAGRANRISWDRIGDALGVPGETLRCRYVDTLGAGQDPGPFRPRG